MTRARDAENVVSRMINKDKFYRLMLWYHGFSVYHRYKNPVVLPADGQFGGKWRFLTIWNVWLQIIFYIVVGLFSLIRSPAIKELRNTVFTTLVLPLSIIVSGLFWALYALDRELILPVAIEKLGYTPAKNHMDHTIILAIAIVNMLLVPHTYPPPKIGNSIICTACMVYIAWINYVHHVTGQWAYPFLTVLSDTARVLFFVVVCMVAMAVYNIGRIVSNKIHGLEADYPLRSQPVSQDKAHNE